jgi:hypothetical protein
MEEEEEKEEEEESAAFVFCPLQVEGISETVVLFCVSACCHMQENSNHRENVRLCKMQEVTVHESCHLQGTLLMYVCHVKWWCHVEWWCMLPVN